MAVAEQAISEGSKARPVLRALQIAPSSYYHWRTRERADPDPERQRLRQAVVQIHEDAGRCYGSRRMSAALREQDFDVGRCKARSLMREAGIEAQMPKPPKIPKVGGKADLHSPNLLERKFEVSKPNTVWAGDVSYIYTATGWSYLAIVVDLFSRKVVGWAMSRSPDSVLTVQALRMAFESRAPGTGVMFHSDQGCHYTSRDFRRYLSDQKFVQSMSRRGNCWDNAPIERVFRSLRTERIRGRVYANHREACRDIGDYILSFYNPKRLHSPLGYVSPDVYEEQARAA